MIVYRELVHQVSPPKREVGHQWMCLNTKSFLVKTFLNMYLYTTTLYIQYNNNFSHVRDHNIDDDEATS